MNFDKQSIKLDKFENLVKKRAKRTKRTNMFIIFDIERAKMKQRTQINI